MKTKTQTIDVKSLNMENQKRSFVMQQKPLELQLLRFSSVITNKTSKEVAVLRQHFSTARYSWYMRVL